MDFVELEVIEGLRWSWNSWLPSKAESNALLVPLSVMCTPLMQTTELPILPYDPLVCTRCGAVLNPYARVDYQSRIWSCSFCFHNNSFPRSYSGLRDTNIPVELFPTYSPVEYAPGLKTPAADSTVVPHHNWAGGLSSSSSVSLSSMVSLSLPSLAGGELLHGIGPAFVFVVGLP